MCVDAQVVHINLQTILVDMTQNTPQPLHNTIVGIKTINHVH